ncbi:MAG TPA: glutaredoxin family protein [Burkholderiaceae bacterium]|nr:glutaredoxin family protein [Burkholderiaceae bacterium]
MRLSLPRGARRPGVLAAVLAPILLPVLWPLSAGAQYAAQFRWVDRNGVVTYGDEPPRDARRVESVAPARPTDVRNDASSLPFELRQAMQRYPVTLYAMPNSPACNAARTFLRQRGIPFVELTVAAQADADELKRRGGGDRLPVLTVGSQLVREFEASAWGAALDAAGYPTRSQLPPDWPAPVARPLVERAAPAANASATASADAGSPPAAPAGQ